MDIIPLGTDPCVHLSFVWRTNLGKLLFGRRQIKEFVARCEGFTSGSAIRADETNTVEECSRGSGHGESWEGL